MQPTAKSGGTSRDPRTRHGADGKVLHGAPLADPMRQGAPSPFHGLAPLRRVRHLSGLAPLRRVRALVTGSFVVAPATSPAALLRPWRSSCTPRRARTSPALRARFAPP